MRSKVDWTPKLVGSVRRLYLGEQKSLCEIVSILNLPIKPSGLSSMFQREGIWTNHSYKWQACPKCGKERRVRSNVPLGLLCRRCVLRGRHLVSEHRKNISLGKRGHSFTEVDKRNLSLGQLRRFSDLKERAKARLKALKFWDSLTEEEQSDWTKAMIKANKDWANKLGARARRKAISLGNTKAWNLMTPGERSQIAYRAFETSIARGTRRRPKARPNRSEQKLQTLLNFCCPNEYKYTGDGEVWFGNRNPDFLNINGRKAVIELFGDYWHSEDNPEDWIHHYNKYGIKCLIIWGHEVDIMVWDYAIEKEKVSPLINKILEFNETL